MTTTRTKKTIEAINDDAFISNNGKITLENDNNLGQSSTDCFSEADDNDNSGIHHDKTNLKEMSDLPILITRLENAVSKLEGLSVQSGGAGGGHGCNQPQVQIEDTHPVVVAYKEILNGPFALFQQLSHQIGAEVEAQVELVKEAFNLQLPIMSLAPRCKAPEQSELVELLKPLADKVQAIQSYREKNRPSKLINHLSTISESIPALFWVSVSPTPGPYVKEMIDAGQFYSNRVLMEYKDKDKTHVDWVKAWIQVLSELQQYIKQNHTTGLCWNPRGGSISAAQSSKPCGGGGGGKVPPPPPGPPPPPPSMAELNALAQQPASSNHAALFQQINQGEEVTKGLRKVTPDMMTHKNPNLRFQSATPYKTPAPGGFRPVPGPESFQTATKPPRFELQGKKWIIEHHNGNQNLVVSDAQMNQAVYVFACTDCLIQVKGKVNSITIDNCKKTSLTFENLVSCVEFINCQRIKAQALGKIPTISIDKTDGIEVYLGKESLDVEIVSSKSSEMNILIPKADGDFAEFPVPEQYKTTWTGKGLKTTVVEQA